MQIRSEVFFAKLLTNKQTNRQTKNNENITSLAEVIITVSLSAEKKRFHPATLKLLPMALI